MKKGSVATLATMPVQNHTRLSSMFLDERLRRIQAGLTDNMSIDDVLEGKRNNRLQRFNQSVDDESEVKV